MGAFVGVLGIEPNLHGPKPCVLPVYDTPPLFMQWKVQYLTFGVQTSLTLYSRSQKLQVKCQLLGRNATSPLPSVFCLVETLRPAHSAPECVH